MNCPRCRGRLGKQVHCSTVNGHFNYLPEILIFGCLGALLRSKPTLLQLSSLGLTPSVSGSTIHPSPKMSGKKAAANAISIVGKVTFDHIKKANKKEGENWVNAVVVASDRTMQLVGVP